MEYTQIPKELLIVCLNIYYCNIYHLSENLDLLFDMISVVYSGGQWAIVCCIFAGWSSGKCLLHLKVTSDSILVSNIAAINFGIYLYSFLTFTGVMSYFWLFTMFGVVLTVPLDSNSNFPRYMGIVIQHCKCLIPMNLQSQQYWEGCCLLVCNSLRIIAKEHAVKRLEHPSMSKVKRYYSYNYTF